MLLALATRGNRSHQLRGDLVPLQTVQVFSRGWSPKSVPVAVCQRGFQQQSARRRFWKQVAWAGSRSRSKGLEFLFLALSTRGNSQGKLIPCRFFKVVQGTEINAFGLGNTRQREAPAPGRSGPITNVSSIFLELVSQVGSRGSLPALVPAAECQAPVLEAGRQG
jgi:hypothetical protein